MDLMLLRRRIIMASGGLKKFIVTSVNGIVSFLTNVAMPTKVTCEFSPVQSGTGDPSPSNIRSISGWTGCDLFHTSKDQSYLSFLPIQSGTGTPSPSNVRTIAPGLSFVRDDNTILNVYGGELALNGDGTSVLTDTIGYCEFNGGASKSTNSNYYDDYTTYAFVAGDFIYVKNGAYISDPYCNTLQYASAAAWSNKTPNRWGYHTNSSGMYYAIRYANDDIGATTEDTIDQRVAKLNEYLAEHTLQICARRVTPLVYNLSGTETQRVLTALEIQGETKQINWNLPDEYQEVEYLESSGTQYIATDYVPNTENLSFECDYMFTAAQSGDQMLFGGNGRANADPRVSCEYYNNSRWYVGCGNVGFRNILGGKGSTLNTKYKMIANSESLVIDGNTQTVTNRYPASTPIPSIYLFCWHSAGGTAEHLNTGLRLYRLSFKNGNGISADFIPCVRKSDSEPGMFDLASGKFYANAGTGSFSVGSNVSTLPTYYGGTVTLNEDGSADLVVIDGYIASYDGETLSNHYISSQAAPNTIPVTGSQVFDFGADTDTYHFPTISTLNSFIGTNSVWHDMNGSITVEYYKNT